MQLTLDYGELPIIGGGNVLLDIEDFHTFSVFKDHIHRSRSQLYPSIWTAAGSIPIHKMLVLLYPDLWDLPPGVHLDHEKGNVDDNRKSKLRPATIAQNNANAAKMETCRGLPCSSRFKGVSFDKASGKWRTRLRGHHVAYSATELEAAIAYDKAAIEAFGVYARLNFPTSVAA